MVVVIHVVFLTMHYVLARFCRIGARVLERSR
jgi:hypothetical protein